MCLKFLIEDLVFAQYARKVASQIWDRGGERVRVFQQSDSVVHDAVFGNIGVLNLLHRVFSLVLKIRKLPFVTKQPNHPDSVTIYPNLAK